jgi:hypothetical protein
MPGIIRDPVQNKTKEEWYGIIQFEGQLAYYDKRKNHDLRFLPAGWQCDMSEAELIQGDTTIWWGGTIPISYEVVGLMPNTSDSSIQGVVVQQLFDDEGGLDGRKNTMKKSKVKFHNDLPPVEDVN